MNELRGRVVVRDTDQGVPGVIVTVYAAPADRAKGARAPSKSLARLGSMTTDPQGRFSFAFGDEGERAEKSARPTVVVEVTAHSVDAEEEQPVLARAVVADMAATETCVLVVDALPRGTPVIDARVDPDEVIAHQRRVAKDRQKLATESRRVLRERVKARQARDVAVAEAMPRFLEALSNVGADRSGKRFVPDGESVHEANVRTMVDGIKSRVNKARVTGAIAVAGNGGPLTADAVNTLRAPLDLSRATRFRRKLLTGLCAPPTLDPCADKPASDDDAGDVGSSDGTSDGGTSDGGSSDGEGGGEGAPAQPTGPATPLELPLLVGNLVNNVASPEVASVFQVATRAGIEEIEAGVNGFALHAGPADGPALHDFHHLQIAFQHVWQELFDHGVVHKGKELYGELVETDIEMDTFLGGGNLALALLDMLGAISAPKETLTDAPSDVISEFEITAQQWTLLEKIGRSQELTTIATTIRNLRTSRDTEIAAITTFARLMPALGFIPAELIGRMKDAVRMRFDPAINEERRRGQRIVDYADHRLEAPEEFEHFHQLLQDLTSRLKEPYLFTTFAANARERSVNFGLVTTYRQRWDPVSYQVGRLARTITLAPKETRRFSRRVSVKLTRATKEVENNLQSRKTETSETSRAEVEIMQKAFGKTNFQLNAEGGVSVGIAHASGSTSLGQEAGSESQEVKKEFRESVFKAAEEYRSERTTEVTTGLAEEIGAEESGELVNPNDELPVTYLFYELQRRYKVSEEIHRLTPIVLVAQEFPQPGQIDDDWILAHDWILRRVLLDDSFAPAMTYLATKVVGDEVSLQEQYQNLQQHRRLVEDLKMDLVAIHAQVDRRYAALQQSIERRAEAIQAEENEGFLSEGVEGLFGSSDESPEALRVREDAARDAFDRLVKQERDVQGRLDRETTALASITEAYTRNLSEHLNRRTQIARLRVHVKQNIMYYMQAIWAHEPPDQRFFRLHDVRVPVLAGTVTYSSEPDPNAIPMPPSWTKPHKLHATCTLDEDLAFKTLEEVADLDNLMGFKGNYMIFPLKESNVLTDFMMTPYLDPIAGLRDPDPLGNWTLEEFADYVCCLKNTLSPEEFDRLRPGLEEAHRALSEARRGEDDEIVVPTDSLFIEALPGAHPILEDYKLMHRVVDVKRAQGDLRAVELENVRAAARLLAGEFEDPTIEKKIVVEGAPTEVVTPSDGDQ